VDESWISLEPLLLFLYLVGIALVVSLLYGLVEWVSRDRVLKLLEDREVVVVIGSSEAYYGRLKVPARGGGGFEVFFPSSRIENPVSLLAFLKENYEATGNKKFLEIAEEMIREFKAKGMVSEDLTLDDVKVDPWAEPSLVSRKVYSGELKDLYAIMRFHEFIDEEERRRAWEELVKIYDPPFYWRAKRRLWNALAYVKDRVASAFTSIGLAQRALPMAALPSVPVAALSTYVQKDVTEIEKRLREAQMRFLAVMSEYDALLENALGHLLTVEVVDVEGEKKRYQGVLREYSKNYILLYDVDYKVQMYTVFNGRKETEGYPKTHLRFYGLLWRKESHLSVERLEEVDGGCRATFKNVWRGPVKLEKLKFKVGGEEKEKAVNRVLFPGEEVTVEVPLPLQDFEVRVEYEVTKEADIAWPRSRVKVIGLGDYPRNILRRILTIRLVRRGS